MNRIDFRNQYYCDLLQRKKSFQEWEVFGSDCKELINEQRNFSLPLHIMIWKWKRLPNGKCKNWSLSLTTIRIYENIAILRNFRRPTNLSIIWTRRSRRVSSTPLLWEPDMVNPLIGHISWPVPDNHTISVTLFKDPRTHELEDKDWTFIIEDVSSLLFFSFIINNLLVQ